MKPRVSAAILVVEDERIIAKDLQQTLDQLGYDAYAIATSAEEALAHAAQRRPDLVLMDVRIQGARDGIDTARILQTRYDVPVVYLTAHADEATIARAKQTGPYGYLLKPVKPAELRSVVEVSLYKHGVERQIRERERWLATTLRSIGDAVVAVDPAGNVIYMNPVAETLAGTTLDAARGRPSRDVLRLHDASGTPFEESPLERVLRTGESCQNLELELHGASGKVTITDSVSPVLDDSKMLGAVMVFRDVTERKRVERQLQEAERLASLGAMAAGVAHEVSNPLAVVMTNAGLLEDELMALLAAGRSGHAAEAEVLDSLHDLQSAASRIGRIVQDLREYSRPAREAAGHGDVSRAVSWAMRATAREFHHRARLVTEVAEGLPPVSTDEVHLGQLLVNLLLNAAHSIATGNVDHSEVRVEASLDAGGDVVVRVRDTGCGIPASELERIFEPFHTTKPAGAGMGLGLSICRSIVAGVGGDISVASNVGEGSTFTVRLPPADDDAGVTADAGAVTGDESKARLLVIDDDPLVLNAFRRSLPQHEVVCVENANDAMDLLSGDREFDLIICDLMMPRMSGMEFHGSLLLLRPQDAARILFVTGGATTAEVREFLDGVPNPRIEKPFDSAMLRQTVQQLLATGPGHSGPGTKRRTTGREDRHERQGNAPAPARRRRR